MRDHPHDRFPLTGEAGADLSKARAVLADMFRHSDEAVIDACAALRHSDDESEAEEARKMLAVMGVPT